MVHDILVMGMRFLYHVNIQAFCVCAHACVQFWTLYRSENGLANCLKLVNKGSVNCVVYDCIINVFID
jgi:hypothetical protein